MIKAIGYDSAVIGVAMRGKSPIVIAYDAWEVIGIVMDTYNIDDVEEAITYFEEEVQDKWHGPETPVWVWRQTFEDIEAIFEEQESLMEDF